MGKEYRPPVGPDNNQGPVEALKDYIPPVGPGSKSLPPNGTFRDLPSGLIPEIAPVTE